MKKEPDIQLDPAIADQMLSNIFDVCDYEGNTVPLTVLSTCKNYRKERNYLQRGIATTFLLLLLLLPILFVTPDLSVESPYTYQGRPAVRVSYHSLLPVSRVNGLFGDHKVPVLETEKGDFILFPDRNGELEVKITLLNGQSGSRTVEVTNGDSMPPRLVESRREGDRLTIFLTDNSGSLDFDACYAKTLSGEILYPIAVSEEDLSLTFRCSEKTVNIFVQDSWGNVLQMVYAEENAEQEG